LIKIFQVRASSHHIFNHPIILMTGFICCVTYIFLLSYLFFFKGYNRLIPKTLLNRFTFLDTFINNFCYSCKIRKFFRPSSFYYLCRRSYSTILLLFYANSTPRNYVKNPFILPAFITNIRYDNSQINRINIRILLNFLNIILNRNYAICSNS
jgi:hypothetical protein